MKKQKEGPVNIEQDHNRNLIKLVGRYPSLIKICSDRITHSMAQFSLFDQCFSGIVNAAQLRSCLIIYYWTVEVPGRDDYYVVNGLDQNRYLNNSPVNTEKDGHCYHERERGRLLRIVAFVLKATSMAKPEAVSLTCVRVFFHKPRLFLNDTDQFCCWSQSRMAVSQIYWMRAQTMTPTTNTVHLHSKWLQQNEGSSCGCLCASSVLVCCSRRDAPADIELVIFSRMIRNELAFIFCLIKHSGHNKYLAEPGAEMVIHLLVGNPGHTCAPRRPKKR